jgi:hypothetical protein
VNPEGIKHEVFYIKALGENTQIFYIGVITMKKIIRNAAKCKKCGDVIESKARCNPVTCSCGSITIDGGKFYLRRTCKYSEDDLIEMSEYEEK